MQPTLDILNLPYGMKETTAIYNEERNSYFIGDVEFYTQYPFTGCTVLVPRQDPPKGYTTFMGDGVKATLIKNGEVFMTDVTVRTRTETWETYERMSR